MEPLYVQKVIDLQESLMTLTESNFDELFPHIQEILNNSKKSSFYKKFEQAINYRPTSIDVYVKLYGDLLKNRSRSEFDFLKQNKHASVLFYLNSTFGYFLYRCVEVGIYDKVEFVQLIRKFRHDHSEFVYEILILFCWFCPIIEHYDRELYDEIFVIFKKKSQMPNLTLSLKSFISNFDKMKENNWELQKKQAHGFGPDIYGEIINNDDVDKLREIAETPGFNINTRIKPSVFLKAKLLQMYPTLIQHAAFVQSIKCFNFLFENHADPNICSYANRTLAQFAVAGGSMEIIKILYNANIDFTGCAQIAAEYHQNNAFLWLYENRISDVNQLHEYIGSSIHQSAKSNNLKILIFCIEHGVDPNLRNSEKYTPLHYAAEFGSLDCLAYLLSLPNIEVNAKDSIVYFYNLEFIFIF